MSKLLIQTLLGLLLWLLPDPELLQAKKPGKWYQFFHQKKDRMQARWNGKHLEIQLKPRKGEGGYSLANRVLNKKRFISFNHACTLEILGWSSHHNVVTATTKKIARQCEHSRCLERPAGFCVYNEWKF